VDGQLGKDGGGGGSDGRRRNDGVQQNYRNKYVVYHVPVPPLRLLRPEQRSRERRRLAEGKMLSGVGEGVGVEGGGGGGGCGGGSGGSSNGFTRFPSSLDVRETSPSFRVCAMDWKERKAKINRLSLNFFSEMAL